MTPLGEGNRIAFLISREAAEANGEIHAAHSNEKHVNGLNVASACLVRFEKQNLQATRSVNFALHNGQHATM